VKKRRTADSIVNAAEFCRFQSFFLVVTSRSLLSSLHSCLPHEFSSFLVVPSSSVPLTRKCHLPPSPLPGIRECSFLLRLLSACADPESKAVSFSKFGKRSQRTGLLWCGRHAGIADRAGPVADAKACGYNHGWQFTMGRKARVASQCWPWGWGAGSEGSSEAGTELGHWSAHRVCFLHRELASPKGTN
jgi:hypothetical protein